MLFMHTLFFFFITLQCSAALDCLLLAYISLFNLNEVLILADATYESIHFSFACLIASKEWFT